ncbi:MAG: hypothetical protein WBK55_08290 [Alphaproteobacteria bacterium]
MSPPVVVGAVAAGAGALATAGGLSAVTFFGLTGFQALLGHIAASLVVSTLSQAFAPKAKKPNFDSFSSQASNRTLQFRQPITSRNITFGEVRLSGGIIFGANTEENKYLHVVIPLGGHKFKSIDEIWLDDDVIPNDWLDADGMVTTGKYAGKVRIRKHLGEDGQVADPFLVAECPEWTEDCRGRGVPYLYIRYELDRNVFTNGLPNASAIVRGLEIFDSRFGQDVWTPNPALHTYWYLTNPKYGFQAGMADIAMAEVEAAANASEEIVETKTFDMTISAIDTATDIIKLTGDLLQFQRGDRVEVVTAGSAPDGLAEDTDYFVIPFQFRGEPRIKLAASLSDAINDVAVDITSAGSGEIFIRKTGEPRYFGGGDISSASALGENLSEIMSAMGGKFSNTGGYWKIFAAVYREPSVVLNESHLRRKISVDTRHGLDESFNGVKGIYVSPLNNWQPQDYPSAIIDAHVEDDLGEMELIDLDLPFTQRASTAQRIATIALNKHRQEIRLPYPTNMHGMLFQPCDTLMLTNEICGWEEKPFEVDSWRFTGEETDAGPVFGVDMLLSETAAGVYSWDSEDELQVDPAPNTNFAAALQVSPPVSLLAQSILIATQDGDATFRVALSWQQHSNAFVRERGCIIIEYRKQGSPTWISLPPVEGDATNTDLFSASLGEVYDIRAAARNSRGVTSTFNTSLSGFSVGSALGVGSTEDWNIEGDDEDWNIEGTDEDWNG